MHKPTPAEFGARENRMNRIPFAERKATMEDVLSRSERQWKTSFRGAKGDNDLLPAKRVT
jgi:hypothetical protein